MPRLLDSTRQQRRDQIADAAMRCFAKQGFMSTSMADIVAEAGLSAGSIYSHFSGKVELMRYAASRILDVRTDALTRELSASASGMLSPGEIFARTLSDGTLDRERTRLLVQVWAETPRDEELATAVAANIGELEAMLAQAALPWARAHTTAPDMAERLAAQCGSALLAASHGFITRIALDPAADRAALIAAVAAQLDGIPGPA